MTRRYSFTYGQMWAIIGGALVLSAFCSGVLRGLASQVSPAPTTSPSPAASTPDPMRQCLDRGGIQLVYINGAWACVTADQAG